MRRFIDRIPELDFLEKQYRSEPAAFVVLYGRRRLGKTSLIHAFIQGKPFIYFLASEESEQLNIKALKSQIAEYTGDAVLAQASIDNWDILFQALASRISDQRLADPHDGSADPALCQPSLRAANRAD